MTDRDPLKKLWSQQKEETFTMSIAEIHSRADTFQSRIRFRNFTEYAAGILVIGVFGWITWLIPLPLAKVGSLLIILGTLYVMWALHQLAASVAKPEINGAVSIVDFHRNELIKQRDALASVWRWYMAPFIPGMLVFSAGVSFASDTGLPFLAQVIGFSTTVAIMAGIFAVIWWLNTRGVKKLDREIAALDAQSL